jgi:hypothetical protein
MPSLSSAAPLSSAALAQRTMFTGLKLAALSSVVALGAVLPMFLVKVPCLGETSPQNYLGGRLGTLTDLSLLRLLNALDPSPDSEFTSNFLHLPIQLRALPSTISPAISSARTRLIIILVLITVISVFGGLFAIARSYSALSKYRKNFTEQVCDGLGMVFISSKNAAGWSGLTEEKIKIWLREREAPQNGEDRKELEAVGVFAVPYVWDLWEALMVVILPLCGIKSTIGLLCSIGSKWPRLGISAIGMIRTRLRSSVHWILDPSLPGPQEQRYLL